MKSTKKPSISKLVANFDNELKRIIMNDLKAIKGRTPLLPTAA
jgi:hypothetical protein